MKRPVKIILIFLCSLIGLLAVVVAGTSAVLFSGKNLAAVVREGLNRMDYADFSLERADLVLFGTFPEVSLRLEDFVMRSRPDGDSILRADVVYAAIDLKAFLRDNKLIVNGLTVDGVYADARKTMDIFLEDTSAEDDTLQTSFALPVGLIAVSDLSFSDVNLLYDDPGVMYAEVSGMDLDVSAVLDSCDVDGKISFDIKELSYVSGDTVMCRKLPVSAKLDFAGNLDEMAFVVRDAGLKADDFPLSLSGNVTVLADGGIGTDVSVGVERWNIRRLLSLVPEAYADMLEGIDPEGNISVQCRVSGNLDGSGYPVVKGTAVLEDASLQASFLPVDIEEMAAGVEFDADLNDGGSTDVRVASFNARSGSRAVSLSGDVRDVLGNPVLDVSARMCAEMDEIVPLLPDSLGIAGSGYVDADIHLAGDMESIMAMETERISASGTVSVRGADMAYCDTMKLASDSLKLYFASNGDEDGRWSPSVALKMTGARVVMSGILPDSVKVPFADMSYEGDSLEVKKGVFLMGNSDFELSGVVSNIMAAMNDKGLLVANLDFSSGYTDVDQMLGYFSGMGTDDEEAVEVEDEDAEGDPFMVPEGVLLNLNTKIAKAVAMGNTVENVGGTVTIDNGVAILRQLGFTSDAAKMQLTAMYKSPRKNHLFVGVDFHLLDIQIDKLIKMVPKVDSLVPMLKSFEGEAEFHLALESNLNSKYELKKSTILGAAAIEGKDLVVLDSDTFDTIASMLKFKKSTRNVIDSLAVDMTVFRDEIDIYPFVVSMDNYQVILSGRHNMDMSFNYHIDCLSPIRLGLDVKGSLGNLKFGITPTKYKNLFRPERRNDIQERTLSLMNMINTSLKESVVATEE